MEWIVWFYIEIVDLRCTFAPSGFVQLRKFAAGQISLLLWNVQVITDLKSCKRECEKSRKPHMLSQTQPEARTKVFALGENWKHQLSYELLARNAIVPKWKQLNAYNNYSIKQISFGYGFMIALCEDSTLLVTGNSYDGQLGLEKAELRGPKEWMV